MRRGIGSSLTGLSISGMIIFSFLITAVPARAQSIHWIRQLGSITAADNGPELKTENHP